MATSSFSVLVLCQAFCQKMARKAASRQCTTDLFTDTQKFNTDPRSLHPEALETRSIPQQPLKGLVHQKNSAEHRIRQH